MPGRKTHFGIGALVSGLLYAGKCERQNQPYNAAEVLVTAFSGGFAGTFPDALEPADNPNHREFFHSVLFGTGVAGSTQKVEDMNLTEKQKAFLKSLSAGYLSHLAADATTPKSLPLLK
ncbi:MAG: metal-dependent hydrolase [Candidatus Nanohaloarchaea archaeon]